MLTVKMHVVLSHISCTHFCYKHILLYSLYTMYLAVLLVSTKYLPQDVLFEKMVWRVQLLLGFSNP